MTPLEPTPYCRVRAAGVAAEDRGGPMRRVSPAARVAVVYVVIALVWIALSDAAVDGVASVLGVDDDFLQTIKGSLFVVASGLLIFWLTSRYLRREAAARGEVQQAYDATLEGWGRALDLRDHGTGDHTRRVAAMTVQLAERLGIAGADLDQLYRGALLHDIGKMGVPDTVLLKPGPLDDAEWAVMRQHPVYGYQMLASIEFLQPALDIPLRHHEKWDGSGYPDGLAGDQIPLAARVFAVVDVYDALASPRVYRDAWPADDVLAHLQSLAGTHLDPHVVPVFLSMLRELALADARHDQFALGE